MTLEFKKSDSQPRNNQSKCWKDVKVSKRVHGESTGNSKQNNNNQQISFKLVTYKKKMMKFKDFGLMKIKCYQEINFKIFKFTYSKNCKLRLKMYLKFANLLETIKFT